MSGSLYIKENWGPEGKKKSLAKVTELRSLSAPPQGLPGGLLLVGGATWHQGGVVARERMGQLTLQNDNNGQHHLPSPHPLAGLTEHLPSNSLPLFPKIEGQLGPQVSRQGHNQRT